VRHAVGDNGGGWLPKQIDERHTGFLALPKDAEAMARCIEQFLTDAELQERMRQQVAR